MVRVRVRVMVMVMAMVMAMVTVMVTVMVMVRVRVRIHIMYVRMHVCTWYVCIPAQSAPGSSSEIKVGRRAGDRDEIAIEPTRQRHSRAALAVCHQLC